MESALLMSETLPLTSLYKAGIRMLALVSLDPHKRVMTFLNMYTEQVLRGKVFAAFETSICVQHGVVRFVLLVRPEGDRFSMWRQRTFHRASVAGSVFDVGIK